MAREVKIVCDKCGKDVYGKEYYTMPISRYKNGKQIRFPTVWLCRECFIKANITIYDIGKEKETV